VAAVGRRGAVSGEGRGGDVMAGGEGRRWARGCGGWMGTIQVGIEEIDCSWVEKEP
jgi:hypothetical protein